MRAQLAPNSIEFEQKKQVRDNLWAKRALWTRSFPPAARPAGDTAMVKNWQRLGFVVDKAATGSALLLNDQLQFVEVGRDPTLPEDGLV